MSESAELIYPVNGKIVSVKVGNNNESVEIIKSVLDNFPVKLVLDLHNVTDLFNSTENISPLQKCVLSFVGKSSDTRTAAREDIKQRIIDGQVSFGILVFKRSNRHKVGQKSWILSLFDESQQMIFIDDSDDHIVAVNDANLNNVTAYWLNVDIDENNSQWKNKMKTKLVEYLST
jgi:hypothetical protein